MMTEPVVQLSEGKIKGCIGENICGQRIFKFLGVPYGKTPIGKLRFKAPQAVEPWEIIKDATEDGDACYNCDRIHEHAKIIQGGEDCLVLNVFTRNIDETKNLKPVMVYIHGGGFVAGSNKSEIYGPELLLTQDIVVVVINYRLGLLGFLSLEDESLNIPGNAGLKDQKLALKWVQRNIRAFGGNPNNVTIFGESAGAASVHFQVLSPSSKGLFHKAILESGTAVCPWSISSSCGPVVAEALNKKGATDQEVLNILQNMTGEEIYKVQEKIQDPMLFGGQRPFGPVVEKSNPSAFITRDPFDLITSGDYNHVPLFIGYTSHEGLLIEMIRKPLPTFDTLYSFKSWIPWIMKATNEQVDEIEKLMVNFYSNPGDPRTTDMVFMDSLLLSTIVATIINQYKTSTCPVYAYRISVVCERNFFKHVHGIQELEGTSHADELGFLWNIQSLPKIAPNTLESLTAQRFVKLWTNFAKTGNPTPPSEFDVILSPVKYENNIEVLDIGKELTILKDLPERNRIELWKKIFKLSNETANYL